MSTPFSRSREAPKAFRDWAAANAGPQAWDGLPGVVKAALRERLYRDQKGLCCYCYVRIRGDERDHLEHIEPQTDANRFEWDNLALSCEGGNASGRPPHCDHAKGDQALTFVHPYRSPVARHVSLRSDGVLKVREPQATRDVVEVLRLGQTHLSTARRSALEAVVRDLNDSVKNRVTWKARTIEQTLETLPVSASYAPLLRDWLERQIRARE